MNFEIYVNHKSCPQMEAWVKEHRQIGVYPSYQATLPDKAEAVERMSFITKYKMVCEQCGDIIYIGID